MFDESDLDAAIARFEELQPQAPRLENTASRVNARYVASCNARDWDAMASILADDFCSDDRRRVTGAGTRRGRDAEIESMRVVADLGAKFTVEVIATRGDRLVFTRTRISFDPHHQGFLADVLGVVETNLNGHIAAVTLLDLEDLDAAIAEIDARYLAGEAAPFANTWSIVAASYAALNRHEMPPTTPDCVNIDHRRETAFGPDDLAAYQKAGLELDEGIDIYVEKVHQLRDHGAVITYAAHENSPQGFDAEWRGVAVFTVCGDLVNRVEVFDEADLDAALTRFEELQPHAPRLENAATRTVNRVNAFFAARDWAALGAMMANDVVDEDRRRMANAGIRQGRDALIRGVQAAADLGAVHISSTTVATRGDRLALCRLRYSGRDQRPEAFHAEALGVVEVDGDGRVIAHAAFDIADIDAALEELETRYLAGEAAVHAHTWSLIAGGNAAANRNETLPMAPDASMIDHRLRTTLNADGLNAYVRASWDLTPDLYTLIESVHRLSDFGVVVTHASRGTSQDDFEAEWRQITLFTVEGDLSNRCEIFDEADLDTALARFDELQTYARRVENAASQVSERFLAHFAVSDWDAMAEILADNFFNDDRRPLVSFGVLNGRDAQMANMRAVAELLSTDVTSTVIATRAARLALLRLGFSVRGQGPDAFQIEVLGVVGIDTENRIAAFVVFDTNDFEGATAELDARYLAGEGAVHSHTWSVISQAYAALNRRALPATTPDWTSVDHRHFGTIEPNALTPNIRAFWDITSEARIDVATVHRLTNLGAVVAHATHATSQEGVEIESGEIIILMVDGDLLSRCEIFNEADLDAALARFDELHHEGRRLEHPVQERFLADFAARDWDAVRQDFAANYYCDDRRRVVNAGVRHGRDAAIEDLRVAADIGLATVITSDIVATRGEHLLLTRFGASSRDHSATQDVLQVVEYNTESQIAAAVVFDLDDFDAAIAELDARYVAGEAAARAKTWSVISGCFAALSRHELPPTTPDLIDIDHRRGAAFASGELMRYLRAGWELNQSTRAYVAEVHRLNDFGAVVTHAADLTSRDGLEAEWRTIDVFTVDGDLISRCEIYDELDFDVAVARFDELQPPAPRLENAVSRAWERFQACLAAEDWAAMVAMVAENAVSDDRRRVVGAGIQRGREVNIAGVRATSGIGFENLTSTVIAIRGERLALDRVSFSGRDSAPEPFYSELLRVLEIDVQERIAAAFYFDLDNIDAAFAELDARYLAGEAAAYAHTWSVVGEAYSAFNRHELPAADWVTVDRRRATPFESSTMTEILRAIWDLTPDLKIHIEAVHRLDSFRAVITHTASGSSPEGFDAEWRAIDVLTVEGDRITGCEIFDEADLDAALARFDELQPRVPRLENAASQVHSRLRACIAARDWNAMTAILAEDIAIDDRRRAVNSGIQYGRDAAITDIRGAIDLGLTNISLTVIATRGARLELCRTCLSGEDRPDAFRIEFLSVVETNAYERIVARVAFDLDDFDAAFTELEARYLAGEAAAYAHTWAAMTQVQAVYNRHELPPTTDDWVNIDHRRGRAFGSGNMIPYLSATYDVAPNVRGHLEAVHRLNNLGVVVTEVVTGTSQEGFAFEWRESALFLFEGDRVCRFELFDESDLAAALARFDELHTQASRPENAASQAVERYWSYFATRDWDQLAQTMADDVCTHDRRRVVNAGVVTGRAVHITNMRGVADVGFEGLTSTVIATRGDRLVLIRIRSSVREAPPGEITAEMLSVIGVNADNKIDAAVMFDSDDIDAAFDELDARYLAGEAASHARTWSVITRTYAGLNRGEWPATAQDWLIADHRQVIAIPRGDMLENFRVAWELVPDLSIFIEAVHRLTDEGAVFTQAARGTSEAGFEAEWRIKYTMMFEGGNIKRVDMFDESDLAGALARFEELQPHTRQPANTASRVHSRLTACTAAHDWKGLSEILADDIAIDDRRRVVNSGITHGRDAAVANMSGIVDVGLTNVSSTIIATRGDRLDLCRTCVSGRDRPEAFQIEFLSVVEIGADERITTRVLFDLNDIDAALEELDARYLAGEAAEHAHTWTVITRSYEALNRRQLPPTTADWVNIDHRRLIPIATGDLGAYLTATWDLSMQSGIRIEAVHRLSDIGAVITHVIQGTSRDGFDAEWRAVILSVYENGLLSRCEQFDEEDLDAALARFEELPQETQRLQNTASRAHDRFFFAYRARDWPAIAKILAGGTFIENRIRVVNTGLWKGRVDVIANMQALADGVTNSTSAVVAVRGERLALARVRYPNSDKRYGEFVPEQLIVTEIDTDDLIMAQIVIDPDDIDAAFAELDARYIAGEAALYAQTWSAMARACAAFNRGELPATTPDSVFVDHRPVLTVDAVDLPSYLRVMWDVTPDIRVDIVAVHRVSEVGAVVTQLVNETSPEGFHAEWRGILIYTFEAELVDRCEVFDEADLDAALARFEELAP